MRSLSPLALAAGLALVGCDPSGDSIELALAPQAPLTADSLELSRADGGALDAGVTVWWYRDAEEVPELANRTTVDAGLTAKGQEWRAVVSPKAFTNARGDVGPVSEVTVVIGNTPPTAEADLPAESPGDVDITAQVLGDDLDGDELTYRWAWLRDGTEVQGLTTDTLPATETEHGEQWTVRVWPSDGEAEGEPAEASVTIENQLPVALSVVITPADATEESTLLAEVTGEDADGDEITWSYTWYVDGVEAASGPGDSLTGADFDKGQQVEVEVVPSDGIGDGEALRSEPVRILNTPPTAEAATITPAEATEATTLACTGTGFADADGDAEGYERTWTVNGFEVGSETTLDGTLFDRDDQVGCTLYPFDGEDVGEALIARPVTIDNTPPVLDSVRIKEAAPRAGDTLTAVLGASRDLDSDAITFRYRWLADGAAVGTGATLPPSAFSRDQSVVVEATPTDGTDDGATVTSAAVTIQNTPPVVSTVSLSPTSPKTDDDIVVRVTGSDADGDSVTYSYTWYVDGSKVSETSDTLSGDDFVKDDTIYVIVTPNDGTDDGAPATSTTLTVLNSVPSLGSVDLGPSPAYETSTLTCAPRGYDDADGDTASYTYRWTVNGSAAGTASTLTGSAFDRGDRVRCYVTPSDGTASGTEVSSSVLTISNSRPVAGSVSLSPTSPRTNDTVTARVASTSDADGDTVRLTYRWKVNGRVVRTQTTSSRTDTLSGSSAFDKKDRITVEVTPSDGTDNGAMVASSAITVANTPPSLAIDIRPETARTADTLSVSITASDADGDSLSYTYAWSISGTVVGRGSTLASSAFKKGQRVDLSVTALDGDTSVTRTDSVTISNTVPTAPTVALTPASAKITDTLTCRASGATDADGDSLRYRYTWTRNGSTYSTTTTTSATSTIPSSATKAGDVWRCQVEAYDGTGYSTAVTSGASRIVNLESCKAYYAAGYRTSGTYTIYVGSSTYSVTCNMSTAGGGWTVLVDQRSITNASAWNAQWDNRPINTMGRYRFYSGSYLQWWGEGANTFDFNDDIPFPNGGEVYADINYYGYSIEDSSVFFWVEDSSGNDLNIWCADGTTRGGSWPSVWSTSERTYMPNYTCPIRYGTGGGYSPRIHSVFRPNFSRTLREFHMTSFHYDGGGGDQAYLYDLYVMVR